MTSLPPEISELKNLTELYISTNQLTSLPPKISELKYLTKLDMSRNQLPFLSQEILELALELGLDIEWESKWKSNMIFVKENFFEPPPVEIAKKGREAVINYFKALEGEKEPLNEVRSYAVEPKHIVFNNLSHI